MYRFLAILITAALLSTASTTRAESGSSSFKEWHPNLALCTVDGKETKVPVEELPARCDPTKPIYPLYAKEIEHVPGVTPYWEESEPSATEGGSD